MHKIVTFGLNNRLWQNWEGSSASISPGVVALHPIQHSWSFNQLVYSNFINSTTILQQTNVLNFFLHANLQVQVHCSGNVERNKIYSFIQENKTKQERNNQSQKRERTRKKIMKIKQIQENHQTQQVKWRMKRQKQSKPKTKRIIK